MQHTPVGETVGSSDSTLLRFTCLLGFFSVLGFWFCLVLGFLVFVWLVGWVFWFGVGFFCLFFVMELFLLFLSGNNEFSHRCTAAEGRRHRLVRQTVH